MAADVTLTDVCLSLCLFVNRIGLTEIVVTFIRVLLLLFVVFYHLATDADSDASHTLQLCILTDNLLNHAFLTIQAF